MTARLPLVHVCTVADSLIFLRGQLSWMRARGLEPVCISSPGPEQALVGGEEQVEMVSLPMSRRITPLTDLWALVRLTVELRRRRPAIVHAHTPKGGLLGMLASWLVGSPVRIYHLRGLPSQSATGARKRLLRILERAACEIAQRVVCVSWSIRDVAVSEGLCDARKIAVFRAGSGNGVDATGRFDPARLEPDDVRRLRSKLALSADQPIVAFVGRVVRAKGIEELAAAWLTVRASHPSAVLVLAGPVEPQDPVAPRVLDALAADPSVRLLGKIDDPVPLYAAADLVVLPTHREGFPNALLEAAAMCRPVVATRVAGCVDAVQEGVTGVLTPLGDTRALAEAINGYLVAPELRAAHGRAGRARVLECFRREALWEELLREYDGLLATQGLRRPGQAQ